jgi:hypothetical protein
MADADMAAFHNRADRDRELSGATLVALPDARAMLFALEFCVALDATAFGAYGTAWPADAL